MTPRAERLDEQLQWVLGAGLLPTVMAEALMNEIAIFFEGGPPAKGEEPLIMEARVLATLCMCEFSERIRSYLNDRLHSRGN